LSVATTGAVVVAPASASDVAEVSALERVCYADPWPPAAFVTLPDNPAVFFVIARHVAGGALAGFAVAWRVLEETELANLAVAPGSRRVGVASQLLHAVLDDARQHRVERVYLEVRESNVAARRLYESNGFATVGRRKLYYRKPDEDALILRLDARSSALAVREGAVRT
jgi:ribosomal-protein-alanine N-acetyltransferase